MADQKLHRAVITFDARGDVRILATDSAQITYDMEMAQTTDACEVGLTSLRKVGPGLNLWSGTVEMLPCNHESDSDVEPVYTTRSLEAILGMVVALEFLEMSPPEDQQERGE